MKMAIGWVLGLVLAAPAWAEAPVHHEVTLPEAKQFSSDRQPLVETPHVKLMALRIAAGKILERHSAPLPAIIHAVSGSGVVRYDDGATEKLDARHVVVLAPDVPHEVVPDNGQEMVLLVELSKGGAGGNVPHRH